MRLTETSTLCLAALGLIFASASEPRAQGCGQWTNLSPTSGAVTCIGVDSQVATTLYAGTAGGGVYKSTDSGASWTATAFSRADVRALVIDPQTAGALYVAADGAGVYKIVNGGSAAGSRNNGLTTLHIHSLAMDPQAPLTLYAGAKDALFKSTDGGNWWDPLPMSAGTVLALAVDPANSSTLYAGTDGEGVFKSGDGGNTWSRASSGLADGTITSFVTVSGTPAILYAASAWDGVFQSLNGGATWTAAGLSGTPVSSLAVDTSSGTLYAATAGSGVFETLDGGTHWTAINSGLASLTLHAFAVRTQSAPMLCAGGNNTVSTYAVGAGPWSTASLSNPTLEVVVVDPANPSNVLAGTFVDGAFKSTDGGATWAPAYVDVVTPTLYTNDSMAVDPTNPSTMYAASGYKISKSTDGGSTWTANTATSSGELYVVAVDPKAPATVYTAGYHNGVLKSTDGGGTWNPTTLVYTNGGIVSLAVDSQSAIWVGDTFGVLRSSQDGGTTWGAHAVSSYGSNVTGLAVDPAHPSVIYVNSVLDSYSPPRKGILKSTDGGSTWGSLLLEGQTVNTIVIDPANTQHVYAGTYNGVYASTDGGSSWNPMGTGLSNNVVTGLAIDSKNSAALYAGTGGGYGTTGGAVSIMPLVPPEITSLSPASGPAAGGTVVTITGSGFLTAAGVAFGGEQASFTVVSDAQIRTQSPAHAQGTVYVQVSTGSCASADGEGSFTYTGCPSIGILPASLPSAGLGITYSQPLTTDSGSGPYTYAVSSGTLPPGLVLSASGLLSGVPTSRSIYYFTVRVTDQQGCSGSRSYSLVVTCGVTVSPSALPAGTVGVSYSQTLTSTGGASPYGYVVSSGTLPPDLSLAPWTGVLSGTPTQDGVFPFTVTAYDGTYCPTDKVYSLTIQAACSSITVGPAGLPGGTVGSSYSQTITASGGTQPYSYAVTGGSRPTGLSLSTSGLLSGTPTGVGTFNFTVTATDAKGCTGSSPYQITVARGGVVYRVPCGSTPVKITTSNHGSSGTLTWDASNCASANYHVVYGMGSKISAWTVGGGLCSLGTSGSATWSGIPDPSSDATRFLWFVVVGDDGAHKEGSWGLTSAGTERGGGSPSGVCAITSKDTTGTCGP